ncbi:HAMP domain-containing sensor histidine kinase [Zavarzinia compransoris]|uniref:histidine kinase n=1 Tax=Zavarzinia compransoris TaxID=1264899 RepID=A0A317DYX4_9PROT|nr:HAMP domain-containing sensor histidine kinase [Zavarzinia compransoris]PWR18233.1 two-component sensor histidine kinase [Zavarzinia compransoris]TDP40874.1 two-component system OmpR family sensor kinase [Zavarzinia compransoris]
MRQRLFWKILLGFWFTFIAIIEGLWIYFVVFDVQPKHVERFLADQAAPAQIALAARIVEQQGPAAFREALAGLQPPGRDRLSLWPPGAVRAAGEFEVVGTATAPDGTRYEIVYEPRAVPARKPGPFDIPPFMVVLAIIGGLGFSAALAWYLTRPIGRLRDGFAILARGDLGYRLAGRMGRRRDEIADLARDFDAMAERLQHLVEARDRLLNDVSHELRSPLARLQISIGLARQNPGRFDLVLDRIEDEAGRIDAMVGELLSLARAENGLADKDSYFDLNSLVRAVVADARFEAEPAGAVIHCPPDDGAEDVLVAGDAGLMRRAIENILRNALRHTPKGSAISVTLEARPGWVEVVVADEGRGVAESELEHLFRPFARGAHGAPDGYGLGLAIAQRAVLSHGGRISGANRPQGGLEVRISLPVVEAPI